MQSKKIHFTGSQQTRLSGQIDFPDGGNIKAYALYAHCFSCGSQLKLTHHIAKALTDDGIAMLRFNFTGLGESQGDFSATNLTSNIQDILQAVEFLSENYTAPQVLIGHSMGGSACLRAGSQIDTCRAVVTLATPAHPDLLADVYADQLPLLQEQGEFSVQIGGKNFVLKSHFFNDLTKHRMEQDISALNKPLLIIQGLQDKLVEIEHAEILFNAAQQPKSLIVLEQADHLFSNKDAALRIGSIIANWSAFYLELS